jgi:hypothetical protein
VLAPAPLKKSAATATLAGMNDGSHAGVAAPPRQTLRYRLRAAGIHFSLSLIVFAVALYLILVHWYPGFHFTVDGGWQGVRIMAAVDLVLGPLLTLIVFNPFKARRLIVFDLACIALAQVAALAWGFYAIHSQHPVAVTFHDGVFYSMTAAPLEIEKFPREKLDELSERTPRLVYVAPPADGDEETRAAMQEIMGQVALWEDPFFFRAFAPNWPAVEKRAVTAERRASESEPFANELSGFLQRRGGQAQDYRFFPYTGRYGACTLAFSAGGELIDALGCEQI